jgi:CBS-domain-containing membrane protein
LTPRLAQRLLGLCAVALVGAVVAVAVVRDRSSASGPVLPVAAPAPGGGWFKAIAIPAKPPAQPRATACGYRLTSKTVGVAHPVLPCGAQVYLELGNERVLTRVIGRGSGTAAEFALTEKLANEIGLHSRQPIKWRFAVASSS